MPECPALWIPLEAGFMKRNFYLASIEWIPAKSMRE